MSKAISPSTAGRGDPYWYEWFVGLVEVVDLLDPTSLVERVAFQVRGAKGWDDVIVYLSDGTRRCYQVKHTRAADSLTFGDLVEQGEDGTSLLKSLFRSWREAGLNDGRTTCILYTNREAGDRWSQTKDGSRRPPLLSFYAWLQAALPTATSIADFVPPTDVEGAWRVWLAELEPGDQSEKIAFLRALQVRVAQADLNGLDGRVRQRLAEAFGVTETRAAPLFDSLCRALKKWTTGHPGVTVEELCSELALPPEPKDLAPAPPPPSPFFPTRVPIADELERVLSEDSAEPVIFLTGEPGCGKTSVLSWLANRRVDKPFARLVGIRFFCFEPIRPENPIVAPDASRVRPHELWGSLLTQLREGLRGRLREFRVPLRNDFLTWQEARAHVLRLADHLGNERGQRLVIVIDGIDHAARAAQTMPQQTAEFFSSLPSPDELTPSAVRVLIAGQSPERYAGQYPAWLLGPHSRVRRTDLPRLLRDDVRALYSQSRSRIPSEQFEEALRVIEEHAKGNTLATVFAVAEAERVDDIARFATLLQTRRMADGLEAYYSSIWNHMLQSAGDSGRAIEPCLTGSLALARRGVRGASLADAFHEWSKSRAWWESLLDALGPLLAEGPDGFRVRHNDIRVFLTAKFAGFTAAQRQKVASHLADHFGRATCDRLASHWQFFDLLSLAGRSSEAAKHLTVDWVFEAATLQIENEQLLRECASAMRALPSVRDWSCVVSVACAAQTLERLREQRENAEGRAPVPEAGLPPFLPSEARVPPAETWSLADLQAVVRDAGQLSALGESSRARSLLERWFGGLDFRGLVGRLPDLTEERFGGGANGKVLNDRARATFKRFGHLAAKLGWALPSRSRLTRIQTQALVEFEEGFTESILVPTDVRTLNDVLAAYTPIYLTPWERLVRRLAAAERWDLVGDGLAALFKGRTKTSAVFRAEATWWALRSGVATEHPEWLDPLPKQSFGITEQPNFGFVEFDKCHVHALINVARAIGWQRIALDAGDIAALVLRGYELTPHFPERRTPTRLLFRAAALLGRIAAAQERGGPDEIRALVAPEQIGQVLTAVWGDVITRSHHSFYHGKTAADLAQELADWCGRLGGDYDRIALAVATTYAEQFPIDFRQSSLWSVLERNGSVDALRSWVRHWLAEDGGVWHLSRSDVYDVVMRLAPLAERLGEHGLAEHAQRRMAWSQIGYRGHKEDVFAHVFEWFREAARRRPVIWRDVGWKLWCACLECDVQGGDNRIEGDILDAVSAAAIRCGARDWSTLFQSTLSGINEHGWHGEIRSRLVDGAELAMREGKEFATDDLLYLWCLAICFSFWTDPRDAASLDALRTAILETAPSPDERERLDQRLDAVSRRCANLAQDDGGKSESDETGGEAMGESVLAEDIVGRAGRGERVTLRDAASAVQELIRAGGSQRDEAIRRVLHGVCSGNSYATTWSQSESGVGESLSILTRLVSDDDLWLLVDAFLRDIDLSEWWPNSVAENLLELAFGRARARDTAELENGVAIQVEMHARWALGGNRTADDLPGLPESETATDWRYLCLRIARLLMESYSSEVVAAALEGLHVLVAHDPTTIRELFAGATTDWSRRWLLSAAESWAVLHPAAVDNVRDLLESMVNEGELGLRLQAWIVLCKLSDSTSRARPQFPVPAVPRIPPSAIQAPAASILRTTPTRMGVSQFVDRHSSVASKLRRLENCGFTFSRLEPLIARGCCKTLLPLAGGPAPMIGERSRSWHGRRSGC